MAHRPAIEIAEDLPEGMPRIASMRQVTHGPRHHFCGYYGICPWDVSGRYMFCLEIDVADRLVEPDDVAGICLIDLDSGDPPELKRIGQTSAWNLQQGAMMHWVDPGRMVYNDRMDGELAGVVLDVEADRQRLLPRPIAAASHDGKTAASVNYARLRTTRPDYGYAGASDPFADQLHPVGDGLYFMDMEGGGERLIVSLEQVFDLEPAPAGLEHHSLWFNHVVFSRNDRRLFFLSRVRDDAQLIHTAAWTVNTDGSDLRCVLPYSWGASHFDWIDGERLVVTTKYDGHEPWRHVVFTDGGNDYAVLYEDTLLHDGHRHFSYDGKWMVTDSYPRERRMQPLYIAAADGNTIAEVGRFHMPERYEGEWRCDLHPRWDRESRRVCFDSTQDGTRQVYALDVALPEE